VIGLSTPLYIENPTDGYGSPMDKFISKKRIKEEMKTFFKELSIVDCLFKEDGWREFCLLLFRVLENQPFKIKNPSDNISSIYFTPTENDDQLITCVIKFVKPINRNVANFTWAERF